MILITDGVTTLPPECTDYDSLLMVLNREDISCSTIYIGPKMHHNCPFGFFPDPGLNRADLTNII